jgi:alpha-glucosidase
VGVRNTLNPETWRTRLDDAETGLHGSMPLLVYDNHDNPRLDRYCRESAGAAPGADCSQIQKMLETILFASRDAALFYFGDEIGMSTGPIPSDPTRRRDAERAPMQWTAGRNAGFSAAETTWLPVLPNYTTVNVETEGKDPDTILQFHKALIALRRTNPVLEYGDQKTLSAGNDKIVAFTRSAGNNQIIVITNFSGISQEAQSGALAGKKLKVLEANYTPTTAEWTLDQSVTIPAYGALIAAVE